MIQADYVKDKEEAATESSDRIEGGEVNLDGNARDGAGEAGRDGGGAQHREGGGNHEKRAEGERTLKGRGEGRQRGGDCRDIQNAEKGIKEIETLLGLPLDVDGDLRREVEAPNDVS